MWRKTIEKQRHAHFRRSNLLSLIFLQTGLLRGEHEVKWVESQSCLQRRRGLHHGIHSPTVATNLALWARLHFDLTHGEHGVCKWRSERCCGQDVEHCRKLRGPAFEQNLVRLQNSLAAEEVRVVHVVEELWRRGIQVEGWGWTPADLRTEGLQLHSQILVEAGICLRIQSRHDGRTMDSTNRVRTR